jgi:hypothetical protein
MREALSLMPPRRRALIDARLMRPWELLNELDDSGAPAAPAIAPESSGGATSAREALSVAEAHNMRVVARCIARYESLLDQCRKSDARSIVALVRCSCLSVCLV